MHCHHLHLIITALSWTTSTSSTSTSNYHSIIMNYIWWSQHYHYTYVHHWHHLHLIIYIWLSHHKQSIRTYVCTVIIIIVIVIIFKGRPPEHSACRLPEGVLLDVSSAKLCQHARAHRTDQCQPSDAFSSLSKNFVRWVSRYQGFYRGSLGLLEARRSTKSATGACLLGVHHIWCRYIVAAKSHAAHDGVWACFCDIGHQQH